ncbi:nuclear division cycle 1 [Haematobia irritans]|uniref:nuclear division cycle 1 n=1 Tax=Haematobia irritans TaxID=7368 RepID=UPI003F50A18E
MSTTIVLECKKLCLYRCLTAVALSIMMQFFLLTVFLLFVNFHPFHLLNWITETFGLVFSFYTWLSIMPLISAVIIYGILLGKSHLAVKQYHGTRFKWLLGTVVRKSLFLMTHIVVGFLTAWLYTRYLHMDYRSLVYKCYALDCINPYYLFLVGAGISAGSYHFFKENLHQEPEVEYPIIQEKKLVKIRSLLYSTLYKSLMKSFMPTICYAFGFWILGGMVNRRLARFFDLEMDTGLSSFFSVVTNVRLLFYAWILSSQILSNMNLMQKFFSILLAEEMEFAIEKNKVVMEGQKEEVTLVEALTMCQVPIIQNLAALDLFSITSTKAAGRRKQIYALSIPGGHPYNWNQLSSQCIALINAFTEDLTTSVKNISSVKSTPLFCQSDKPTATEAAEKILLRQYNETYGIRRMVSDSPTANIGSSGNEAPKIPSAVQRINEQFEHMRKQFEQAINTAFHTIPGVFYLFGEPEGAKTAFLLSNSQMIVWIIQGLAGICGESLVEDQYGVVQVALPQILRALMKLKGELDKLNNVNLNGKKLDRNLITLKNSVRRSLYKIVSVFGDYLRDLLDDPMEVRRLQCFMSYQEF